MAVLPETVKVNSVTPETVFIATVLPSAIGLPVYVTVFFEYVSVLSIQTSTVLSA